MCKVSTPILLFNRKFWCLKADFIGIPDSVTSLPVGWGHFQLNGGTMQVCVSGPKEVIRELECQVPWRFPMGVLNGTVKENGSP